MTRLDAGLRSKVSRSEVVQGHLASVLLELAAGGGADLIAVGRDGGSRLGERLLGSVTERILHGADCDVLVAP